MDRSERKARIEELETWIRDTNTTYENDAMPDAVRLEWDANNSELDSHRAVMVELENRDLRMQRIADQATIANGRIETGTITPRNAPQQINRMSESDIYNLDEIRPASFRSRDQIEREFRDRAKRAVEIAKFPTVDPKIVMRPAPVAVMLVIASEAAVPPTVPHANPA